MSSSARVAIVCLLAVMAAGCDRKSPQRAQANVASDAALDNASIPAPDEATAAPSPTAAPAASAPTGGKPDRSHKGATPPALTFTAPDGKPVTLAAFKGKPVLLNLWATWCGPCVAEMPTLDTAAKTLAGKVQVIAVSQDLDGAAKVTPFFAARHFTTLKPYLDPKLGLSIAYQTSLPTTILIDSSGHEVWRMTGGNAWNTPAAATLIAEAK